MIGVESQWLNKRKSFFPKQPICPEISDPGHGAWPTQQRLELILEGDPRSRRSLEDEKPPTLVLGTAGFHRFAKKGAHSVSSSFKFNTPFRSAVVYVFVVNAPLSTREWHDQNKRFDFMYRVVEHLVSLGSRQIPTIYDITRLTCYQVVQRCNTCNVSFTRIAFKDVTPARVTGSV